MHTSDSVSKITVSMNLQSNLTTVTISLSFTPCANSASTPCACLVWHHKSLYSAGSYHIICCCDIWTWLLFITLLNFS